ncbi:hypothetical protein HZA96_04555 [Candidatus Woesearchaeota archaeon]|nr:hypothetical protein [Candidatus Woesearchaeota archaeon]
MVKALLVTRPKHDIPTSYLYDFSNAIVKTVKEINGMHITTIEGDSANRVNFEKSLAKENYGLLNVFLTKERIVYALACDSLELLGKTAIEQGTKAYIGYKARFMLVVDPTRFTSPNKDSNALPFRKACNRLINSLISGLPVANAIELTKKEYISSIRSLGTSKDDPYGDVPLIRFALAWNLEFLDMCGDPCACF